MSQVTLSILLALLKLVLIKPYELDIFMSILQIRQLSERDVNKPPKMKKSKCWRLTLNFDSHPLILTTT